MATKKEKTTRFSINKKTKRKAFCDVIQRKKPVEDRSVGGSVDRSTAVIKNSLKMITWGGVAATPTARFSGLGGTQRKVRTRRLLESAVLVTCNPEHLGSGARRTPARGGPLLDGSDRLCEPPRRHVVHPPFLSHNRIGSGSGSEV